MKVIFLQDVPNVADAGEVKIVANGFARNYLIPSGLAALATVNDLKRTERIKQAAAERRLRESEHWEEMARGLEGTNITLNAKQSPSGQFYGAITTTSIAQELSKVTNREIDRRMIGLEQPITAPGIYEVVLTLSSTVAATISVTAEAEE